MYGWDTLVLLKHYLESGLSKTAIARQLGVSRRAIYHWIRTGQLDRELSGAAGARRAAPRPTKLDRYGGDVLRVVATCGEQQVEQDGRIAADAAA